jgi:hypothetical protein
MTGIRREILNLPMFLGIAFLDWYIIEESGRNWLGLLQIDCYWCEWAEKTHMLCTVKSVYPQRGNATVLNVLLSTSPRWRLREESWRCLHKFQDLPEPISCEISRTHRYDSHKSERYRWFTNRKMSFTHRFSHSFANRDFGIAHPIITLKSGVKISEQEEHSNLVRSHKL